MYQGNQRQQWVIEVDGSLDGGPVIGLYAKCLFSHAEMSFKIHVLTLSPIIN